jgi:DNA-binding LytR/AlgR family response regulator
MTDKVTDEVNLVIRKLSEEAPQVLAGFREDVVEVLEQSEIIRFYAASGKIFAVTTQGEYSLRRRLYELEEMLDKRDFVRISNSEIINLRKAKGFDLSFAGTICVTMSNGDAVYVSRRYVSKIKQVLGL